ncbi:MAG: hypothetical protein ACI8R4_004090 [Paracoccaceae bacterium]
MQHSEIKKEIAFCDDDRTTKRRKTMTWMTKILDRLTGYTRVTLMETERMLVLRKGRFDAILGPGEHRIQRANCLREVHNLDRLRFVSPYDRALFRERPDLAEAHLSEFRAGEAEVLVVLHDGRPYALIKPEGRVVYWTDAGAWDVERYDVSDTLNLPKGLVKRLVTAGLTAESSATEVAEGHVGILSVDGVFKGQLPPAPTRFGSWGATWRSSRSILVGGCMT